MPGSSPPAPSPDEIVAAYEGARRRIDDLLRHARPDELARPVAACPGWSVADIVAHLTGAAEDVLAGRLDGVTTDPWTRAQVERHQGRDVGEVLDTWAEAGPAMVEQMRALGMSDPIVVFDAANHEHDLRAALTAPGARDTDAVEIGAWSAARALTRVARRAGLPPLRVRDTGGREWTSGDDDPAATLTATPFELMRSGAGRRTVDQIAALDWGGADPSPWLPAFTYGPFTPPPTPTD